MGTLQEKVGTTYINIKYKAPGFESLRPAHMRTGIATKQNNQKIGQRKAAAVTAHHVLRRRAKSSCSVKSNATGFANLKIANAITRTTINSLKESITWNSKSRDERHYDYPGASTYVPPKASNVDHGIARVDPEKICTAETA